MSAGGRNGYRILAVTSSALAAHLGGGKLSMDRNLQSAWWPLRLAFFVGPFVAGLDKFFHLLTNWDQYLSPLGAKILGGFSHPFMLVVGVIEMCVGLMIITKWTKLGAYIASIWLVLIALNLITTGHYFDVALRDVGLALSAFGLAKLTEVMERSDVRGFVGNRVAA